MSFTNRPLWDEGELDQASPDHPDEPTNSRSRSRLRSRPHTSAERPETPVLLDVDDVCELLRIGRTTVFAEIKAGELARIKINRRTLFDPADISAFIERKRQRSASSAEVVGDRAYRRR